MACWSAENATQAYLRTVKMGKRAKEPDVAEFVSALAAGNSSQVMVEVCAGVAGATTIALVAAAHQTGGQVVCILPGLEELHLSEEALGPNADCVEFVAGDAKSILVNNYIGADFVLIDCTLEGHEGVFGVVQASAKKKGGAVVVGYNACKGSGWRSDDESKTQLLPIGEGLLVSRIPATTKIRGGDGGSTGRRSRWVVTVDKCTGEEHVFRITSAHRNGIQT
ncbi:PREDICTED: uncharacterized protein LOC104611336 [Nelumbo nucifera]|uniref:Uncharacterized protein LOC104611336 n=2 Tax=Nelumbo nucifera TaxID=4432 RepID=A0A1U8B6Q3_NELNU|nr:PREDICTED: uncharacterized protein LOC104611336 [Nelumbo nucifera]DAD33723.1 TPA_asm: hypothetical protein HUJ06_012574 [Nelumbo nucifera]